MTLVYIVCPGHSGSTLLDMLLGQHKDVFSTGELIHLPNQYHRNKLFVPAPSNGLSCSCGKSFYDCNFWGEFVYELDRKLEYDLLIKPLQFKIGFLMRHPRPHQQLKHKILRRMALSSLKNYLPNIDRVIIPDLAVRLKNNQLLFNLIQKLSNRKVIVDSSKDYFRLHYLLKTNLNIKVIVLIRSIFGVAASNKKHNYNVKDSAYQWIKYYRNLNTILNFNQIKSIHIKYEDFVENTLFELNRIYDFIGISPLEHIEEIIYPPRYHIVAGNGLRYEEKITLNKSEEWKSILSLDEKQVIDSVINTNGVENKDILP